MTSEIQGTLNTTNNATVTQATPDSTTAVLFKAAEPLRLDLVVDNRENNKDLWVRLVTAASGNAKEWFFVPGGEVWIMSKELPMAIYTGEVSGIFNSGGTNTVQVIQTTKDG